ncbi:lysophospholipid acyltransferase family protein [Candidatus Uabimicrobium amorphum]|uniref:DUF374 domain-containing protein n=1 Tax=Uabimicrobium amorphum TaxID=2596890 RepID=A0A5S9F1M5_UABAM|nr:DUF374 domain-containing protein [Candidatus Uabimicrobium amorphum]BBM82562.1 hypothetical protein UABAM_00905 [Candidatus Uabimicrobium amorphum]
MAMIKKIRKKIKRFMRKVGKNILKYTIPYIYMSYCWFVWKTSKVQNGIVDGDYIYYPDKPAQYVAVLWHQDVFFVSYAFKECHGLTIASSGAAGEIIAKMLGMCNFTVFRGGSSKGKKRRIPVLEKFIEYAKDLEHRPTGITVDGSSGPIYRMKSGAIVMAQKLDMPLLTVRIWCKRKILLKTWDRTMIPLPFNDIRVFVDGPFYVPAEAEHDEEAFDKFHKFMENELLEAAYRGFKYYDKDPKAFTKGFPEGWEPKKTYPEDEEKESK